VGKKESKYDEEVLRAEARNRAAGRTHFVKSRSA
jgi:hypothetical protein